MLTLGGRNIASMDDLGTSKGMLLTWQVFIEALIDSAITFRFNRPYNLKGFLTANLSHFQGAPAKFDDLAYAPLFEEVETVTQTTVDKRVGKWFITLKVKTRQTPNLEIQLFTSTKRHLVASFLTHQHTPRKAMTDTPDSPRNSLVRDARLFEAYFVNYARTIARELKHRQRVFGFEPADMNSRVKGLPIAFETDSLPLTLRTDRGPLPIHCYPSTGSEVRRVTQLQYGALVKFLLWYFRTDEHLYTVRRLDEVTKMGNEHGLGSRTYLDYLASIERKRTAVESSVRGVFNGRGIDPTLSYDANSGLPGNIVFQIKRVLGDLHELLVKHGKVPDLQLTGMRPSTAKDPGTTGIKATVPDTVEDLVTKTHKREVIAVLGSMPWDVLKWLLKGHRTVPLATIRDALENPTNTRYSSKMDPQGQRTQLRRDQLGAFIDQTQPWIAVNQLNTCYNLAVTEGLISRQH